VLFGRHFSASCWRPGRILTDRPELGADISGLSAQHDLDKCRELAGPDGDAWGVGSRSGFCGL